jgi:hypothetical protein
MRTARMLEAEWRQVLLGSVRTGAKEDESTTGWISAAGFHCYGQFSLGTHFKTYEPFIYLVFFLTFLGGCGKPQILNQWIQGHACIYLQYLKWLSNHCKSSLLNTIPCFYRQYVFITSEHWGKDVPASAMKAYRPSSRTVPVILTLSTCSSLVFVLHTLAVLPLGENSPLPTEQKAGWASELLWTFLKRKTSFPCQKFNPQTSVYQTLLLMNHFWLWKITMDHQILAHIIASGQQV